MTLEQPRHVQVLLAMPGTIFVDKYGGAEFTVEEIVAMVGEILLGSDDGKNQAERFCDRFELKKSND